MYMFWRTRRYKHVPHKDLPLAFPFGLQIFRFRKTLRQESVPRDSGKKGPGNNPLQSTRTPLPNDLFLLIDEMRP